MKNSSYEKSAKLFAIGVIGIAIVMLLLTVQKCNGQQIGYLIAVTQNAKTEVVKTTDKTVADSIVLTTFKNTFKAHIVDSVLVKSNFFEFRTETVTLYCEKKEIRKNDNGKIVFRKIRKH